MTHPFTVRTSDDFAKDLKRLIKKYPSLSTNLEELNRLLSEEPIQGEPLGRDCYKIRLHIKSKRTGKRGGGRVITCVRVVENNVYLLALYDKSEVETLSDDKITERLKSINE